MLFPQICNHNIQKNLSQMEKNRKIPLSVIITNMDPNTKALLLPVHLGTSCHTLHLRKTFLHFLKSLKKKTTETVSDLCR